MNKMKLMVEYSRVIGVLKEVQSRINELRRMLEFKFNQRDYEELGIYIKREIKLNNSLMELQELLDVECGVNV